MSQREDRISTAVIPAFSGINERASKTDLQSQESTLLEGTFPYFTGLQAKLPGKALLAKFEESVYGIHQFWTPYGYGNNLYQFTGAVNIDPWITPPGKPIKLTLPPLLTHEDIVLDELGYLPYHPLVIPEEAQPNSSNGTEGTPGGGGGGASAVYTLYKKDLWLFTRSGDLLLISVGDTLYLYSATVIESGDYIDSINAGASPIDIAAWNETYPQCSVQVVYTGLIGTSSDPIVDVPTYEVEAWTDPSSGFAILIADTLYSHREIYHCENGAGPFIYTTYAGYT